MKIISRYRNWLNSNLLLLFAFPVLVLIMIYISYGTIIGSFLQNNYNLCKVWQLNSLILTFSSDIDIPFHIKALGFNAAIFIYMLFVGLLISHLYLTYDSLSSNEGSKLELVLKTILVLLIFIFSIRPGLNIWIALSGYFIIVCIFLLIFLYWIVEKKTLDEKE